MRGRRCLTSGETHVGRVISEDDIDEMVERARALGTDYAVLSDILRLAAEVRRLRAPAEAARRLCEARARLGEAEAELDAVLTREAGEAVREG